MISVSQTTDYVIQKLQLKTKTTTVDITGLFEELNIFDNLFTPVMSGSIVIRDAVNLLGQINFDGYTDIEIEISKSADPQSLNFKKTFKCYKISERTNVTSTSQIYALHFISKEYLISETLKINQYYKSTYSNVVQKILTDYLGVPYSFPEIGVIYPSSGVFEFILPNLTPIKAIDWLARRSVTEKRIPDFVFYQTQFGFNFAPLSYLLSLDSVYTINLNAKNLTGANINNEFLGARSIDILSDNNTVESVNQGLYSSKFIGFDTLTKKRETKKYTTNDFFENITLANDNLNLSTDSQLNSKYDSKVVTYPVAYTRNGSNTQYIKDNEVGLINYADNSHEYALQRNVYFANIKQKRLQLTMPGNFGLFSGRNVNVDIPKFSFEVEKPKDEILSGKYIITGTRHIISYSKHETLIEVATDSYGRRTS